LGVLATDRTRRRQVRSDARWQHTMLSDPSPVPFSKGDPMRVLLGCALLLVVWTSAPAEDKKEEKIDAKLLVGKWSPKEKAKGVTVVVEFTKDGKMTVNSTTDDGTKLVDESAYKLDGNKLVMTMKVKDKEETRTTTIKKLTDTELVGADEKGQERTLVRIRDK
jgi:uncharacterized protein (TIGR03066 family)